MQYFFLDLNQSFGLQSASLVASQFTLQSHNVNGRRPLRASGRFAALAGLATMRSALQSLLPALVVGLGPVLELVEVQAFSSGQSASFCARRAGFEGQNQTKLFSG